MQSDLKKIKDTVEEFFAKMTIPVLGMAVDISVEKNDSKESLNNEEEKNLINLEIKLDEPQILIGQGGQTLFELQRILRMILNKKIGQVFYLNLDINDYKKKKIEYLKNIAKETADEVSLTRLEKTLMPMPAYERRIIHAKLAERTDIITESQGLGADRHIVVKPK